MSPPKILIQLDSDPQPSVFDAVVAADSGVDQLFRHGGVSPDQVRDLVYGAMFTRGPDDLKNTAVFVGGSRVSDGEAILQRVVECFFGPMRVSVMIDSNGANTTAAAAVLAAARHVELNGATAVVLAATGPVGSRIVRLLAREGGVVKAASRSLDRAQAVCDQVRQRVPDAQVEPLETHSPESLVAALADAQVVFTAGAAGVELLPEEIWKKAGGLKVAIDLNAVPPLGIGGIEVTDRAKDRNGVACYGAIGVGGTKMKIHKAALRRLFNANDQILDAEEIFAIGKEMCESRELRVESRE